MKSLEILLRLIDNLLTAIKFRKAQNERDKIEQNPFDFFTDHFGGDRLRASKDKTNETEIKD